MAWQIPSALRSVDNTFQALAEDRISEPPTYEQLLSEIAELREGIDKIVGLLEPRLKSRPAGSGDSAFAFEPENADLQNERSEDSGDEPRLPLLDAGMLRKIIGRRQLRPLFFDTKLFTDPAWDMLLDLAVARAEKKRVSITSLCIASGVPPTTALRWIRLMLEDGLVEREDDPNDRRRSFVFLSQRAYDAVARFFADHGSEQKHSM